MPDNGDPSSNNTNFVDEIRNILSTKPGKWLFFLSLGSFALLGIIHIINVEVWYYAFTPIVSALFVLFTVGVILETSHFTNLFRWILKEVIDNALILDSDYLKTFGEDGLKALRKKTNQTLTEISEPNMSHLLHTIIEVENKLTVPYRKDLSVERKYDYKDSYVDVKTLMKYTIINPLNYSYRYPIYQYTKMSPLKEIKSEYLFFIDTYYVNGQNCLNKDDLICSYLPEEKYCFEFYKEIHLEPNSSNTDVVIRSTRRIPVDDKSYILKSTETPVYNLRVTLKFYSPAPQTLDITSFSYLSDPIKELKAIDNYEKHWKVNGWLLPGEGVSISW